jgi:DNA-binding CsgD family transcriptional regulator
LDFVALGEFAERIGDLPTTRAVGEAFTQLVRSFGLHSASASELRHTPEGRICTFSFITWPREWQEIYAQEEYARHDPIPLLARLAMRPFDLAVAFGDCEKTEKRAAYAAWVAEIGVRDVFAVPMHYPGDDIGLCVTVAERPIDDPAERHALLFASIHVLHRCRDLNNQAQEKSVKAALSEREIACMGWVLEGKSDRDIGQILGISHTTVHFHVERVKQKLGVRTRVQAAKLVLSLGYI